MKSGFITAASMSVCVCVCVCVGTYFYVEHTGFPVKLKEILQLKKIKKSYHTLSVIR